MVGVVDLRQVLGRLPIDLVEHLVIQIVHVKVVARLVAHVEAAVCGLVDAALLDAARDDVGVVECRCCAILAGFGDDAQTHVLADLAGLEVCVDAVALGNRRASRASRARGCGRRCIWRPLMGGRGVGHDRLRRLRVEAKGRRDDGRRGEHGRAPQVCGCQVARGGRGRHCGLDWIAMGWRVEREGLVAGLQAVQRLLLDGGRIRRALAL
ncbi:hypothetical protein BC831DRAFT_460455, partial [Entophlyctis helioformis]